MITAERIIGYGDGLVACSTLSYRLDGDQLVVRAEFDGLWGESRESFPAAVGLTDIELQQLAHEYSMDSEAIAALRMIIEADVPF